MEEELFGVGKTMTKEMKFIFAYDPKIKRRVTFVLDGWKAKSLVTGYSFKYITKELLSERLEIIKYTIKLLEKEQNKIKKELVK